MSEDYVIDAFGAAWFLDTHGLAPEARERLQTLWGRCRVAGARAGDPGVEPFVASSAVPYRRVSGHHHGLAPAPTRRRRPASRSRVHAWPTGDGPRRTVRGGKSTAALILGRHFGYLSDETVAIEVDGRISPYPKPVSVITKPDAPWDKHESSPDELCLIEADGTAHLEVMVVLERDPDVDAPELTQLPLADALLAIIVQSSSLPTLDQPLRRLAELASRSGGPYLLRYSEISECVELLGDLLSTPPVQAGTSWTSVPGPAQAAARAAGESHRISPASTPDYGPPDPDLRDDTLLTRAPWIDAVQGEGGTIVLIDHTCIRLGPVGEVVWHTVGDGVALRDVHGAVVEALGPHPDSASIVSGGVSSMIASGVIKAQALPTP